MKTVLITGGAGFIGSHIVDLLLKAGKRVVVADNLSTGRRANVSPAATLSVIDVTHADFHELVKQVRPEAIIHLAAQVSVSASVADPVLDTAVNVLGTVNVLEAARRYGVPNFVFASSAAVYGTPAKLPLLEEAPLGPLSPYGIAKVTAEHYIANYCSLFGLRAVVVRYANVYGPRQLPDGDGGVIAKFAEKVLAGESPVFHGDGGQTRDFVYVKDVAEANYLALQYLNRTLHPACATFNISTGEQVSLLDLYSIMQAVFPAAPKPLHVGPRIGDIRHSCLDNRKAYNYLGWSPQVTLEQGLQETIAASLSSIRSDRVG